MTRPTLGEAILAAMTMTGMKQVDVAQGLRCSPSQVGNWTRGKYLPRLSDIVLLEEVLGLRRGSLTKFVGVKLPDRQIGWRQGIIDALLEAPIDSADSKYLIGLVDDIVAVRASLGTTTSMDP